MAFNISLNYDIYYINGLLFYKITAPEQPESTSEYTNFIQRRIIVYLLSLRVIRTTKYFVLLFSKAKQSGYKKFFVKKLYNQH